MQKVSVKKDRRLLDIDWYKYHNGIFATTGGERDVTSVDPLNLALTAKTFKSRTGWWLVTAISLIIMVALIAKVIVKYSARDTFFITKLKMNRQAFPAVTFCNMNPYKKSALSSMPVVGKLVEAYLNASQAFNNSTTTNNKKSTNEPRRKRLACSCTFTNTASANYSSSYVRYDVSESWSCGFTCCRLNAPKGKNSRIAKIDNGAIVGVLTGANVISGIPAWIGMRGSSSGIYSWYDTAVSVSGRAAEASHLCSHCQIDKGGPVTIKTAGGTMFQSRGPFSAHAVICEFYDEIAVSDASDPIIALADGKRATSSAQDASSVETHNSKSPSPANTNRSPAFGVAALLSMGSSSRDDSAPIALDNSAIVEPQPIRQKRDGLFASDSESGTLAVNQILAPEISETAPTILSASTNPQQLQAIPSGRLINVLVKANLSGQTIESAAITTSSPSGFLETTSTLNGQLSASEITPFYEEIATVRNASESELTPKTMENLLSNFSDSELSQLISLINASMKELSMANKTENEIVEAIEVAMNDSMNGTLSANETAFLDIIAANSTNATSQMLPEAVAILSGRVKKNVTERAHQSQTTLSLSATDNYQNDTVPNFLKTDKIAAEVSTMPGPRAQLSGRKNQLTRGVEIPVNITAEALSQWTKISHHVEGALDEAKSDASALSTTSEDLLAYVVASLNSNLATQAGYDAFELIKRCVYNGVRCWPSDFQLKLDPSYGNCYTFNANRTHAVGTQAGKERGLSITYFIGEDEYLDFVQTAGVKIIVHSHNDTVLPDSAGVNIPSGFRSSASMRQAQTVSLSSSTKPCAKSEKDVSAFNYNTSYSTEACLRSCYQDSVIERCQCGDPRVPLPPDSAIGFCNVTERNCVNNFYAASGKKCYCPPKCEDTMYDITLTTTKWSRLYAQNIRDVIDSIGLPEDDLVTGKQFAQIDIFYEDLTIIEYAETPAYDINQVLSDISCILGLLLGVSMLTTFEVALLADYSCNRYRVGHLEPVFVRRTLPKFRPHGLLYRTRK